MTSNGTTVTSGAEDARRTCIQVAAEFVAAQPGGTGRILAAHRRGPGGNCAACAHIPIPWPCTAATIAHRAQGLPELHARRSTIRIISERTGGRD